MMKDKTITFTQFNNKSINIISEKIKTKNTAKINKLISDVESSRNKEIMIDTLVAMKMAVLKLKDIIDDTDDSIGNNRY